MLVEALAGRPGLPALASFLLPTAMDHGHDVGDDDIEAIVGMLRANADFRCFFLRRHPEPKKR